jgi:hypothetical protein
MRNILVDHSRRHAAAKRGGDALRVTLSRVDHMMSRQEAGALALNDALKDRATTKPLYGKIVELHFLEV